MFSGIRNANNYLLSIDFFFFIYLTFHLFTHSSMASSNKKKTLKNNYSLTWTILIINNIQVYGSTYYSQTRTILKHPLD